MLRLRARGISDLRLLRALERAPRALFMPQRYADIAARDIALPIGCGQTAPPPSIAGGDDRGARASAGIRAFSRSAPAPATPRRCSRNWRGGRLARAPPDARARGGGAARGVRARQCPRRLGPTVWRSTPRPEAFDRILVHALIEPPAAAADRLCSPRAGRSSPWSPARPSGEQRIVRLTRQASGEVAAEARTARRGPFMPLASGASRGPCDRAGAHAGANRSS